MELELNKKIKEIQDKYENTKGVILVDKLGLPIQSSGEIDSS